MQAFGRQGGRRAAAMAAGLWAVLCGGVAAAQEHTFVLHHFLSPQSAAHTQMLVPWAERVEAASGGRIDIEIYPAMTFGGRPPELVAQARDGVVDMIWTLNGYTPGLFPRSEVLELPTVFAGDARAAGVALHSMMDDLAADYAGLHVLWLHTHGGHALQMRDRAVRGPDDLAGLTLRTPSRVGGWTIEALGASPVAMPVPDLPQALQRGTVEGALIPFEVIPPLQLQAQTEFQIEGEGGYRFGTAVFQVSMNADRWAALPEDIRAIFEAETGPDWWAEVGTIWNGTEAWGLGVATAAGNTHVTLTADETAAFDAAMTPVVARWVADMDAQGIDGAALVDRARSLIAGP